MSENLLISTREADILEPSLEELAYTLQVGREAMEDRVIFVASDKSQLMYLLDSFLQGNKSVEGIYRGQRKPNKDIALLLYDDEDAKEMIRQWHSKGKVREIAQLWAKGLNIDWKMLYGEHKPCRISLPTYPFAKERYWLPGIPSQSGEIYQAAGAAKGSTMTVSSLVTEVQQKRSMRLVGKRFELAPLEGVPRRASYSPVAIVASAATRTFAHELSRYLPGSEVIEPDAAQINLELECTIKRQQKDYAAVVDVTGCAGGKRSKSTYHSMVTGCDRRTAEGRCLPYSVLPRDWRSVAL
nr:hypothetical protein [Bacillus thuringiensis]